MKCSIVTTRQRRSAGLTLFEVIILTVIVAVLLAIALAAHQRQRARWSPINCVNHLKQLGIAFRGYGIDLGGFPFEVPVTNGGSMEYVANAKVWPHFQVLSNEINNPSILVCTDDPRSKRANSFSNLADTNISYFIGVEARETTPKLPLVGDDHFTVAGKKPKSGALNLWTNTSVKWTSARHGREGNILMGDGSVQKFSSAGLKQMLVNTGVATNRLLMP
jgi:prepilin-type processing-associated H-X9-DG protein